MIDDQPIELKQFEVVWRLPGYEFEKSFTVRGEFTSAESAAEYMFLVANDRKPNTADGRRWKGMQHRSLSVGDNVTVNGKSWHCASMGWERTTPEHSRSMEEHAWRLPNKDEMFMPVTDGDEQVGILHVEFEHYDRQDRPVYKWQVFDADNVLLEEGDDIRGGHREAVDPLKAMHALVGFLSAEAELHDSVLRTNASEDEAMFNPQTRYRG